MSYSSREFSGFVKDRNTGAPIPGAVVVAMWKVSRPKFLHGTASRILHVTEAVTDQHGKYTLPAWGPKSRPAFWKLDVYDTSALIFKPGYKLESTVGHNIGHTGEIPPALREQTLLGSITEELRWYALGLSMTSGTMCCDSTQLESHTNFILLLSEEGRRLAKLGVPAAQLQGMVDIDQLSEQQKRTLEERRKVPRTATEEGKR